MLISVWELCVAYNGDLLVPLTAFFEYKEDGGQFPNPPSYSVATTLPSYDEAERSKAEAAIPLVTGRVTVPASLFVPFS